MTSKKCYNEGIIFSAVHDSYWTHAKDIDRMNVILREQFIALYEKPVLEDFDKDLRMRYPSANLLPVPARGSMQLKEVLNSEYFFS
jgi:DNA-directed RNA polymerase